MLAGPAWEWAVVVHPAGLSSSWHPVAELRSLVAVATSAAVSIPPDLSIERVSGLPDPHVRVTVRTAGGSAAAVTAAFGLANAARGLADRAVEEARRLRSGA